MTRSGIRAAVIGATGYAGAELVRLLSQHPAVEAVLPASVSHAGEDLRRIYPHLQGAKAGTLLTPEEAAAAGDIVFAALPSGVGEDYAAAALDRGVSCIDLSADFRFDRDENVYAAWYGKPFTHPALREFSVYGLPELNRDRIQALGASSPVIIGNPGCYPTAAALGMYPVLARGLYRGALGTGTPGTVIVDAASGITGAGREPAQIYHFPEASDSFTAYKVGNHRHSPEIARNTALMAGRKVPVIFTPHLAPMSRGILATVYIPLEEGEGKADPQEPLGLAEPSSLPPTRAVEERAAEIRALYEDFYRDEPFVRVLPGGMHAATNRVRQSNFCDISVHLDGSTLIILSAIDNMVKGAAGQAVQNMNILLGLEETAGLRALPALF